MKNVSITINASDGKTYPCRVTLGAMRRFDLAVFIWCCCMSACKADGVEFSVSLDDFCDLVDISTLSAFNEAIAPDEKKTKK